MTQRVPSDPYWQVNCSAYALAMLVNDSVLGGLTNITGRRMRALSTEPTPDPGSPGLNLGQLKGVAQKLSVPFYVKSGQPWSALRNAVGSGASRAVLQLEYDEIPLAYRCQASSNFGHAVLVVAFDGDRVRASDPLCSVTKWYPESALRHAAEWFAEHRANSHGVFYGISRVVPKQA
jgi:hypothetical protein